jgi:uncharacterized protein YndB with AHSA1/START domain
MSHNAPQIDYGVGEGHDLAVERVIAAPPPAVFDAFLDLYREDRPDWIVASHLDLRVGGRWTVVFHPPAVDSFREERVISELDPPRRLAYTARIMSSDPEATFATKVLLSLERQDAVTRVVLIQRGFPNARTRDDFAAAWPDVLGLLERRIRN